MARPRTSNSTLKNSAKYNKPSKLWLLGFISFSKSEFIPQQTTQILERFAGAFDSTYTRFLDLQKAEAQAREAKIEAALERVRGKTMAMHNSDDVSNTVATMFDQLVKLDIETIRCGIGIMHEPVQMEVWTAKPDAVGKADLVVGRLDMRLHPLLEGGYHGWKNKEVHFSYEFPISAYFPLLRLHLSFY